MVTPAIPQSLMASVSAELEILRPDACQVRRRTTSFAGGGEQVNWALGSTVSCRVAELPIRPTADAIGGRETPSNDYQIALPWGTSVERGDQIIHITSGRLFDVLSSPGIVTHAFEAVCRCVDLGEAPPAADDDDDDEEEP